MVAQGVDPRQQDLDAIAARETSVALVEEQARLERDLAFSRIARLWLEHYQNDMERRASSVAMATLVVNRYLMPALGDTPMPHIGRSQLTTNWCRCIEPQKLCIRLGRRSSSCWS